MRTALNWIPLIALGVGYAVAFRAARRAIHFSLVSPWFVGIAMVCFLGLAAMARRAFAIRMPARLRRVRDAERRVYRRLRMEAFGTLLRRTPLRLLNMDVYLRGRAGDTTRLAAELEAAEASHFYDALLVVPYMVYVAVVREWPTLWWFCLAQVLLNACPIMHLRLTRRRLERVAAAGLARNGRTNPRGPGSAVAYSAACRAH